MRLALMDMDERYEHAEEEYRAKQREASFAGLLAGLFMLFLLGAAALAVVTFWPIPGTAPVFHSSSVPEATD
jgi:hypothetical protein